MNIRYRDYTIVYNPKPVPLPVHWDFFHDDYDGAPDAFDHRHGVGADVEDCKRKIDEIYEEEEEEDAA